MHSLSARQGSHRCLVPTGVAVHWFSAGLQDVPLHAPSFAAVHCTHVPALHTPLPAMFEHSVSFVQAAQAPALHAEAVASLQSAC